ncbi:hypothetical protein [Caballeronia sp. LZ001]|nr:hypothetical protein [Caballeronia sp. LZ001]MDR5800040.1 hypothetical protein [Caballeronia sp. LZ001]
MHKAVLNAIIGGDGLRASAAMLEHLVDTEARRRRSARLQGDSGSEA